MVLSAPRSLVISHYGVLILLYTLTPMDKDGVYLLMAECKIMGSLKLFPLCL